MPKPAVPRIVYTVFLILIILALHGHVEGSNGDDHSFFQFENYQIVNGTYLSGSFPGSINELDSDYLIIQSQPSTFVSFCPSGYNLQGSTTHVSGGYLSLTTEDDVCMTVRSYQTGMEGINYVDNGTSNVDSSVDIGTHSNFSAQQYGPDSIFDTLTEENTAGGITYENSAENYSAVGQSSHNFNYSLQKALGNNRLIVVTVSWEDAQITASVSNLTFSGTVMTHIANVTVGTGYSEYISLWYLLDSSLPSSPASYNVSVTVSENITQEIYMAVVEYSGVKQSAPDDYDTDENPFPGNTAITLTAAVNGSLVVSGVGEGGTNVLNNTNNITNLQEQLLTSSGSALGHSINVNSGSITVGWNNLATREGMVGAIWQPASNYELDLEVQWTNIDYTQANEELCIYAGSMGTENLRVDVWNGGSWVNVISDMNATSWNNVTISPYLNSSTFTIRFKEEIEVSDPTSDSWNIDVSVIRVWSNEHIAEVEFVGLSPPASLSQIYWTISSSSTTSEVTLIFQLFNHTLGDYPADGEGYLSYVSSTTEEEKETIGQTILSDAEEFVNSTGHWKIKIKGTKETSTAFDLKIDLVEVGYPTKHIIITEYTFSNATVGTVTQLNLTIDSRFNPAGVNVSLQVWNYSSSKYMNEGEASLNYTTILENQTDTIIIDTNPQSLVSNGEIKIRITGIAATQYQQGVNYVTLMAKYAAASSPFNWLGTLPYIIPALFVLMLVPILRLRRKKTKEPIIVEDTENPFSSAFGVSHQEITGKKILLEIDPSLDYQKTLFDFVTELQHNDEKVFIFTSASSPLHIEFPSNRNRKFYLMASESSQPTKTKKRETYLPATDLSVLLNTFSKIPKRSKKIVNIVFDNLSDTILMNGFEKTYRFLRWLLEMPSLSKATVVFIFNPSAHETKILASIRSLFRTRLALTKKGAIVWTL